MASSYEITAASGSSIVLPSWGRAFWQDPNDGKVILLYASGNYEVDWTYSSDAGVTWSPPVKGFRVDDFSIHSNFDCEMDSAGTVHCAFRYNNSGCYAAIPKASGVWFPSGDAPERGFCDVSDADQAKGFNGSIAVFAALGFGFDDVPGPYPAARIAAKNSSNVVDQWYVNTPFQSFPALDTIAPANAINAGPLGGFPIYTNTGTFGAAAIIYSVDATGIVYAINEDFVGWSAVPEKVRVDQNASVGSENGTAVQSGYMGRLPLGPNMGWCRSFEGSIYPILVTQSGVGLKGWELYTTANESAADTPEFFGTIVSYQTVGATNVQRWSIPENPNDITLPWEYMDSSVKGGNPFMSGGCPVDVTVNDRENKVQLYFQNRQTNGYQTIYKYEAELSTENGVKYTLPNALNLQSGLMPFADVDRVKTGGSGLVMHWQRFKALHHPVAPGQGVSKKEMVVTVGSGIADTATRLYSWNYDDSVWDSDRLKVPTFSIEWTALSGTEFVGIKRQGGITSSGLANLFDQTVGLECLINNGDFVVLEFARALPFSRAEFLYQKGSQLFLQVDFDASLDDVNYQRVHVMPSGGDLPSSTSSKLIKCTSEFDGDLDATIYDRMDTFIAKYLKLTFTFPNITTRSVREIRLYGGHQTKGDWETSSFLKSLNPNPINYGYEDGTETFDLTSEGSLPLGWRTTGDWDWLVDIGNVSSGVFARQTVGSGSSAAVRSAFHAPVNTSGILEVDIVVNSNEKTSGGTEGRDISFDTRYDLQGNGLLSETDPNDDFYRFYTITDGITSEVSGFYTQANQFLNEAHYYRVRATAPVGTTTLRWIYKRGATPSTNSDQGVVWIDNVVGVDVNPYWNRSIFGYLESSAPNTNDFTGNSGINAYISGITWNSGMIYAYTSGNNSPVTGVIYGYLDKFEASGSIYGYADANDYSETIYAFASGAYDSSASTVYGYAYNTGVSGAIYGWVQNRKNEYIAGFLKAPSGLSETIYGYTLTPEFLTTYGYLSGPIESTGNIYAYLKANGDQGEIYAYASGANPPSGNIYAYLKNTGVSGAIWARCSVGDNTNIYGYLQAVEAPSGGIYSYVSGVDFESSTIYGYIPGISGTATGIIYGYIEGVEVPNSTIYGNLVGIPSGDDGCDFPLSDVPSVTIPTGNFFS